MKTLTKLLLTGALSLASTLGISYQTNAQYSDQSWYKSSNKRITVNERSYKNKGLTYPSNRNDYIDDQRKRQEKKERQIKKDLKKGKTKFLDNHNPYLAEGSRTEKDIPFVIKPNEMFGGEYFFDTKGQDIYTTPKSETKNKLSFNGTKELEWLKKYKFQSLKNTFNKLITKVKVNNQKASPSEKASIYDQSDFKREYEFIRIEDLDYILDYIFVKANQDTIRKIIGNSKEDVLPILLVPMNDNYYEYISNKDGTIELENTEGILYATTNFKEEQTQSGVTIVNPPIDTTNQKTLQDKLTNQNTKITQTKVKNSTNSTQNRTNQKKDNFYTSRGDKTLNELAYELNVDIKKLRRYNKIPKGAINYNIPCGKVIRTSK